MNVCLIFSGIAKLLCKFMVTRGVNLSKIWSKNYLYDHFNQRLHINQTSQCYFTQVLIFHCIFRFNHHHILLKVYNITCCSWLFRGRPSPLFFRLASNAFPDIVSVARKKNITRSLGIGGPDVKRYHLQFGWTKCTICERFEPRSHFNSRLQSFIVRVNVVLNALRRKTSRHVCCPGFHETLAHARFDLHCHVRLLNQ